MAGDVADESYQTPRTPKIMRNEHWSATPKSKSGRKMAANIVPKLDLEGVKNDYE